MDTVDRETLATLARHSGWPSVTLLLPTHRKGAEKGQDPLRLKNLLKSAEEHLHAHDMRTPEIDTLLRPARTLLEDGGFWRETLDGLAVFMAEDTFHRFKVDIRLAEYLAVGDRFAIRPLLPALHTGERFYVLALSKNRVRLLEGERHEVHELDLTGVPDSLSEALKYDDWEKQVQFHSRTPAGASGAGRRPAIFHGHGGTPDEKDDLVHFFQKVDKGIHDFLHDDDAPLLLAGVDYLLALYRDVSSYAHLVDATLSGNPDESSAREIHERAVELLAPHFRAELDRDREQLEELLGTASASRDLREIVPAAHEGRVGVLFVPPEPRQFGLYDPSSGRVEVRPEPRNGDWDLTDLAAAETLLHGGTVHAIESDESSTAAAAIFRY